MRKFRHLLVVTVLVVMVFALAGCGGSQGSSSNSATSSAAASSAAPSAAASSSSAAQAKLSLAPGDYKVKFTTDSTMFHVNEANKDLGDLHVAADGTATVHISLVSKTIKNLFLGTAEQAQAAGAVLLEPTTDTVKYEDGTTEEVYGFDVPVPVLDQQFDLAIIGEKGKWYDHKVSVSSPVQE